MVEIPPGTSNANEILRSLNVADDKAKGTQKDPPVNSVNLESEVGIEWNVIYLVKEKKPHLSFRFFCELINGGFKGLCVSRIYPDKLRKSYDLNKATILWLSESPGPTFLSPIPEKLYHILSKYIRGTENCVLLLDGIEYIITHNDFLKTLRFIEDLSEVVALHRAILVIPVSPDSYESKELTLLERNTIELTENHVAKVREYFMRKRKKAALADELKKLLQ